MEKSESTNKTEFSKERHAGGGSNPLDQLVVKAYLEWVKAKDLSSGTRDLYQNSLRHFFNGLGSQRALCDLSAGDIETFIIAFSEQVGVSGRQIMQTTLRSFLRFCLDQGHIPQPLDHAIPRFRAYRPTTPPRGLSEEQSLQVLSCVNRDTPSGVRNYAILQMLHSYGVRGGQIRALGLADVHWQDDQILFTALKGGKDSLLPLTREVGASLLDYLQNARPPSTRPEVFLTCRRPYRPLWSSSHLSAICRSSIEKAGIDVEGKGAHRFRHGFAIRMVGQGHGLKAVADVLGHRRMQTTFHYAKVDFKTLEQVALDWPEELES